MQDAELASCVQTFPDRTHALLQEADIDLVEILKEEGVYVQHGGVCKTLSWHLVCRRSPAGRTHCSRRLA